MVAAAAAALDLGMLLHQRQVASLSSLALAEKVTELERLLGVPSVVLLSSAIRCAGAPCDLAVSVPGNW